MRVSLQRVRKFVKTSYVRGGVFGHEPERQEGLDQQDSEWDDVIAVMSPEEAEVVLRVLQALQTGDPLRYLDGMAMATMIRGLEADLRKLTDQRGLPVFEAPRNPDNKPGKLWGLTPEAKIAARQAPGEGTDYEAWEAPKQDWAPRVKPDYVPEFRGAKGE